MFGCAVRGALRPTQARQPDEAVRPAWRRLGAAPLIEDNSVRSRPTSLVNALFVQDFGKASLMVEILNLTDSRKDDIAYSYVSRMPGEPADGVDDVHFHPVEPRAARLGMKINF